MQSSNTSNTAGLGGEGDLRFLDLDSAEFVLVSLCSVLTHGNPSPEVLSELLAHREGFGLAWVLLQFVRLKRSRVAVTTLDLSKFSLGGGKLNLILSALPEGPESVETLKGGSHVCTEPRLTSLCRFLQNLRRTEGGGGVAVGGSLRTLVLAGEQQSDLISFA
uniref:Uncharacterized protein n=1 Tax=Chromera velia CCMP2878 TaxID=1169474 RepID=A0A0G4FN25_9ALVE|eukprot:Cvel_17883.t1-p1 / transcript=Cvel_17883.t1 / gene=Cvel_17883 / organism=Chromera_velia_CCMP2878 / gene_product=hypothetical protein / transcript_product=hypothetical protein / location=Cvel_scaffold1451:315-2725(-) / protein_length=162 / sequence_SO=supercontig / SO=protein_coding / is_pseudo=false